MPSDCNGRRILGSPPVGFYDRVRLVGLLPSVATFGHLVSPIYSEARVLSFSGIRRGGSDHVITRAICIAPAVLGIAVMFILQTALLSAADLRAEVIVRGNAGAVEVVARDASIDEVLSALSANYGLRYRGAVPEQRRVTGTHVGSLREVVKWLLKGCDFVLLTDSGTIGVLVIRATEDTQIAAPHG